MDKFSDTEKDIRELFLSSLPGKKKSGSFNMEFSGGTTTYGSIKYGTKELNKELDFNDSSNQLDLNTSEIARDLLEASIEKDDGPLYASTITINDDNIEFTHYWMNDPELSVATVKRDHMGKIPTFMFTRKFDNELLDAVSDNQVFYSLEDIVYLAKERNIAIHPDLIEYYAVYDWITDCRNGSWNQYFRRVTDGWSKGDFSRNEMYRGVITTCGKFEFSQALDLFKEAIGIYANYVEFVDKARIELEIELEPKNEEPDIFDRFYELDNSVVEETVRLIRERIHEYKIKFE